MNRKIISVRCYGFYDVYTELVESPCKGDKAIMMKSAYSKRGDYIGSPKEAQRFVKRFGIIYFEKVDDTDCVCSIGFSPREKKWYGWSHRAIFGFKLGSKCKPGNCHYVPRRSGGKGKWTAKTWFDAKQMAKDFAESVS